MDESIKQKILSLLDQHRIMTLATLRPDGWPQATTVGYVNDGLTIYFLCGLDSQKTANIARDNRVSLTIDHDADQIMEITGLSMAARATAVTDRAEVPGTENCAAGPDAQTGGRPHLPADAGRHISTQLHEGLRPH
jgi:nitroimidazol reductase NimA-like FMN-containing flavoprotein (pyridoxamine 5'-phosphate oxidase superfamily)